MILRPSEEGEIPFDVPVDKPCSTWYRVVGDLSSATTPLVVIHGGPGAAHEYLLPLIDLHKMLGQMPIVFYDQLGCGRSTHLREKAGDEEFWTVDLFIRELDNVLDHFGLREDEKGFHLLGHSWGGMLAGVYAARNARGLKKLILADAPSSVPLHIKGINALVDQLPSRIRDTLRDCERRGDHESKEYEDACMEFYKRHLCRLDPFPQGVQSALEHLGEDTTVYFTMYGPSELTANGSLRD